ncbi:unnamed protein product [Miscanthus lutarioriparius]|uniref:non-specific serine/threonine protein kinase n=1 Tax=Miscanthus lutarioriparius TaxID=422564 RepID=A0A811SEW8_9POAL|nr:unnamed protein product [Miscanthus lutarioriparius]
MATETLPETLPVVPDIQILKLHSDTSLEASRLNKPSASLPTRLPEPNNLSKPCSETEPKDKKPNSLLNESVDHTSLDNISADPIQDKLVSECPVDEQKKDVNQGNMCRSLKPSSILDKECGLAKANESGGLIKRSDTGERGISSRYRPSNSSDISDESSCSSITKPHKANDSRWEAIQMIRTRDGIFELSGTKSYFVMKVMDKASLASRKKLLRSQTEKDILQCLDHPFLPTLYTHFETDKFSCLVMEFCPGGDMHTLRQRQRGKYFPEQAVKFYVAEILLALEYLHMLGIIYRDLKPENVLIREDGHIMLTDFDLSLRCAVSPMLIRLSNPDPESLKKYNQAHSAQQACVQPSCVMQPSRTAPTTCFGPRLFSKSKKVRKPKLEVVNQIIKGEGHGSAVDWWTFGIFLYELLFGKTPFKGTGNRATLFNVIGQPLRFPEYSVVSFPARDLIWSLLVKEPQQRLGFKRGATEIKQHPFLEGVNWALIRCASPPEVPRHFDIEKPPKQPVSTSESTAQKGCDNYLEFGFF